ncbi:MAG: ABC transporter ATP-binding protein [Spirochaetes bacterium]|nr:ABC transporter ATP-binding protein [Spirochaetota bacterium]
MAIKVNQIKAGYKNHLVINDLSLNIPKGKFCSIIGPNGCGKSTLLRTIARTLKISAGSISIFDQPLYSYETKHLARKLAFLAQSPHIPDQFSVRELVSYGRFPYTNWLGRLKSADHKIIEQAMEMTEIQQFSDRELLHLSGGERQRAWIAMALAQEAEILLLDEPTTYLDIAHQFQTLELICRLHQETKRTILMVLHDLNQAARYSDYIFVLKQGQLVTQGKPGEIITEELLKEVFQIETKVVWDDENHCPYFIPLKGDKGK